MNEAVFLIHIYTSIIPITIRLQQNPFLDQPHHPPLLKNIAEEPLPRRRILHKVPVLLKCLVVQLAPAAVDVDLVDLDPAGARAWVLGALPEVADDVEDGDDEDGEEGVEEGFGGVFFDGAFEGDVDLCVELAGLF